MISSNHRLLSAGREDLKTRTNLILPVNMALLIIGLADLATTLFWLATGRCVECNPIMAATLQLGLPGFIAVKLCTLAAYVGLMEWYRRRHSPDFARTVGRITLLAYLGIYLVSLLCVNALAP